ncbi:MAG: GDSL-type esterase/lipase family protein [Planctomycetia bacterium]|nr:GDSL-type esterase/lipase family protein [Planctomycetia bacterium]
MKFFADRFVFFGLSFFFMIEMIFSGEISEKLLPNVQKRCEYSNSKIVFEQTGKGRVAFLGGSITEMEGYRPMVCTFLRREFPKTDFEFISAGISSTCSTTGAFRLFRDVLDRGKIDLFFLEFAVNDDQDAHLSVARSIRGMEGIIRHIRKSNPNVDIVITYFVNSNIMEAFHRGELADSIKAHREVAEHYRISTINLAKETTERIDSGKLTWKQFGGVHPAPLGNRICTDMIESLLMSSWKKIDGKKSSLVPYSFPAPLDPYCYERGEFLTFDSTKYDSNWTLGVPDWKNIAGSCRPRYIKDRFLFGSKPGARCRIDFTGTAIGAFVLAGPDAGSLNYRIDNGPWKKIDLYHEYSQKLHYPRTIMFDDNLPAGSHLLEIKIASDKNEKSTGTAIRIMNFVANISK